MFKGTNTPKSILMYPKDKIPLHLKQNIVYKLSCPEKVAVSLTLINPADVQKISSAIYNS